MAFAFWMVGYSFNMSWDINNWHLRGEVQDVISGTQAVSICVSLMIWVLVGALLYQTNEKEVI